MAETPEQRIFRRGSIVGGVIVMISSYEGILRGALDAPRAPETDKAIEKILEKGHHQKILSQHTSASDMIGEHDTQDGYVRQALNSSEKKYRDTHREACERIAYGSK